MWLSDHEVTQGHVTKWKLNMSSSTRLITTKFCRVVTYEENSPIAHDSLTTKPHEWGNSHDKLKTKYLLFCKAYGHQTWQGGNLWWRETMHEVLWPSPFPQNIWPPNFSGWCLMVSVTYPWSCLTLASCVHEVTWKIKDKIFSLQQGL